MTFTLQLLALFLATTAFAAPSTRSQTCNPTALTPSKSGYPNFELESVYVAIGTRDYFCNEGTYESDSIDIDLRLYDASCLNGTDYFDEVINVSLDYFKENPGVSNSNLDAYIKETFSLNFSGQAQSTSSTAIEIQISESSSSETIDVSVVQGTQTDQGATLTNEDVTVEVIINNPNLSPPSCATGSDGVGLSVVYQMYVYKTRDNN